MSANDIYVKYMEKYFDSTHFGSSSAAIELDGDELTDEILIGAVHRYRWRLTGAVMAYKIKDNFEKEEFFNLTSENFIGTVRQLTICS